MPPDRHRQNRRLCPADADDAGKGPRAGLACPHTDPGADPRAGRPGQGKTSLEYGAGQKLNVALIIGGGVGFDDQDSKLMRVSTC